MKSGIELPKVAFSTLNYWNIPVGSFFTGFDLDNLGLLSKIDSTGTITVIEGAGGGVIQEGANPTATVRIDLNNVADAE